MTPLRPYDLLATAVLLVDEDGNKAWRMTVKEETDDYQCLKLPVEAYPVGTQIVVKRPRGETP